MLEQPLLERISFIRSFLQSKSPCSVSPFPNPAGKAFILGGETGILWCFSSVSPGRGDATSHSL